MSTTLDHAALFAAFYGPRDQLGLLTDALLHSDLELRRDPTDPDIFTNTRQEALWRFVPPQAPDTTVVHLALNGAGVATSAWSHCRRRLEALLSAERLAQALWGYTLVYQAVWAGAQPDLAAILPHTRRLGAPPTQVPGGALAHSQVADSGDLWLLDAPTRSGEGAAAATLYLALAPAAPASANDQLIHTLLFGPDAALLMPDLLAHKGYFLLRQYRAGRREERYKQVVEHLHTEALTILGDGFPLTPGGVAAQPVPGATLTALFDEYVALLRVVPSFKRLRSALAEQVENMAQLAAPIGVGDVTHWSQHTLRLGRDELDLLITQGQDMLDVARQAVELVQAQAAQTSAARQQGIATLLAVLGIGLAVPQIITTEVAGAVILPLLLRALGQPPPASVSLDLALLTQLGCIALLALLVWGSIHWWQRRATR